MPGTKNSGRRKLTEEQRAAIRASTDPLNIFLAREYGVSRELIYKIRRQIVSPKDNASGESHGREAQVGSRV